jgi:hypothetical protein
MGICVKMLNSRGKRCEDTLGCSWIEVNNEVHTIVVDDQDHPQISEIHGELLRLPKLMHDAWYMP